MSERSEQNYYTLNFDLGDEIRFTEATLDARYMGAGLQDLTRENGPYQRYTVVDFPDDDRFSSWSRIGVRKDGFHGQAPLYYVRCMDVLNRKLRPMGKTTFKTNVEPIHLADGRVVETEVNGISLEDGSGYVFVDDRDIKVRRNVIGGEWQEITNEPPGDDHESIEQHIQGLNERESGE